MVDFIELMIKNAEEHGDNYKRCDWCGGVHIWKKGAKAKIVPMLGQPPLMILKKAKKKKSDKK